MPDRTRQKPLTARQLAIPGRYLAALLVAGVTLVPIAFVVLGGFRTNAQLNADPTGLPSPWVLDNYRSVLGSSMFWQLMGNSALIAVTATVLTCGLGAAAGYALARYRFRGREGVYTLFTAGLLFPLGVASLPVYLLLRQLHLLESWFGVALAEAAFGLPVTVVILRPFMAAIPGELEDAAAVDGCGRLGFLWRIMLPLARPALVTVAVLAFLGSWNAYQLPMLVFNEQSHFTLPLGVASFQSQYSQDTAGILAYTALSMLPALGFFVFAERRIVGGMAGAVKG
ncbi:carbohydrate ABC transporter permease [Kitasatospora sp. NPDC092948]|uniref:carbohydrate ABC transporter permease n=1 Tax=Kitasatospora sp. NPDC092948 TaxID=3364088 RepID=UPI0038124C48